MKHPPRHPEFRYQNHPHPAYGDPFGVGAPRSLGHPFQTAPCRDNFKAWEDIFDLNVNVETARLSASEYYATRRKKMMFWCSRCPVTSECADLAIEGGFTGPYGGEYYVKGFKTR